MRAVPLAAAMLAAAGSLVLAGTESEAAGQACYPAVTVGRSAVSGSTLAPGIVATDYTAYAGGLSVPFHVVHADLAQSRLALLTLGATGIADVPHLADAQPSAVVAMNGDLFHLATDNGSSTSDGLQVSGGELVKAGGGEPDAMAITGSTIGPLKPRFAGLLTVTDTPGRQAHADLGSAAAGPQFATVRHQSPLEDRPPVKKTITVTPTGTTPTTVVVTAATPATPTQKAAPAQATVSLIGVNTTDGGSTALVITPAWGTAALSANIDPTSTEYLLRDGTIVSILPAAQAVTPPAGETALVLLPAVSKLIPWLGVGDTVTDPTSVVTAGQAPTLAIGGNAVLVQGGTADPTCRLASDDSQRPRVAIGSADAGHTAVLAVSDGDVKGDPGLTLAQWSVVLHDIGAVDALNLDGGQSATLLEGTPGALAQINSGESAGPRQVVDGLAVVPH